MIHKNKEYKQIVSEKGKIPSQNQTEYSCDYLVVYFIYMTDFKN